MDELPISNDFAATVPTGRPDTGIFISLPDVAKLGELPPEGFITFRYSRENLRLGKDKRLSADLRLHSVTEVECCEEDEMDENSDTEEAVDRLFNECKDEKPE
jgi:hypothetical protein